MEKKNSGVEAVDKALQILNSFSEKREELTLTEIAKQINQYKSTTSRLCASLLKFGYIERLPNKKYKLGNAIKNGIPVAIIGAPNSGKSTLLNALLNEDKAIVSEIEGTTRDIIEDNINIEGVQFRFIDTAGIRKTNNKIEKIGIDKALENAKKSNLVLYVVDVKNNVIKQPKIQETSTLNLLNCFTKKEGQNFCNLGARKELIPTLNRRLIMPFYIPIITLVSCLLFLNRKNKFLLNKFTVFILAFTILVFAELFIRYTGLNKSVNYFFILFPFTFLPFLYLILSKKFAYETDHK